MILEKLAIEKNRGLRVAVIGATGGIGSAFLDHLVDSQYVDRVHAMSRIQLPHSQSGSKVHWQHLDLIHEETIANAAAEIANTGYIDVVILASGVLHDGAVKPEKDWRNLDAKSMTHLFAINTIGPALVMKHFAPLLPKDSRSIIAALSARVGSISDNRLGGWYSYRASKAALNQVIRTFSIELSRKNKNAIILGLHPGTVATGLSEPYQANAYERFTPAQSAGYLLSVIDIATPEMTGKVYDWNGELVPE